MKAPALNLHRANRPDAAPGLIALAAGVVVLVLTMQYLDTLTDQRESAIAKQEQKFRTISNAHRHSGDAQAAKLMAQQRYAAEPARALVEGGWNPGIALLSVDIAPASRTINMQFETRSAQEALSYADWLQAQPGTENVTVKRQTEKPGPPVKSVETSLQVTWRPFFGQPVAGASATASEGPPAAPPGGAPK
ncbi:hypothetical protein AWB74_00730 [Caballeronia arvi]|uniref:Uncharacterized protein n=1 Tax=Caballeronia arvi TaxID=1777135 RepID=A0A158FK57_9BURK|nr:hypothetical protein [Caballeronia arvi]SAL20264.1 hypothetical protein AWB74_00730 [Caballeronia arvi]